MNWGRLISRRHGVGDTGLYTPQGEPIIDDLFGIIDVYDSASQINYANGSVGSIGSIRIDAIGTTLAEAEYGSAAQVGVGPSIIVDDSLAIPTESFTFQSYRYSYSSTYNKWDVNESDDELAAAPFIRLDYAVGRIGGGDIVLSLGYTLAQTEHSSGPVTVAQQSIFETATTHNFTYFGVSTATILGLIGEDPALLGNRAIVVTQSPGAVSNVDLGFAELDFPDFNPRRSTASRTREILRLYAQSSADLDVTLNELALAVAWQVRLGKRIHVMITAGPTLNLIDSDLDTHSAWYISGRSSPIWTSHESTSQQDWALGAAAGLLAQVDIDSNGRLFIEVGGRYHWVDKVGVSAGTVSTEVDASSFSGHVAGGFRF